MSTKILTYHNVGKPPKEAKLKTLFVGKEQLKRQLKLLKLLSFDFLSLKDLLLNKKVKRGVLLTFDDAYADFWENALPIFMELEVRCLIFVPVALVESYNKWDYERIRVKKPIMNWEQIKELYNLGFEIGSHSLTHPYLSKIDPQKAWEEIYTSKNILEDKLGTEIKAFCYPYGDYNQQVRDMVEKAGYSIAFTTKHGSFEKSRDLFEVRRITIFGNDLLPKFLYKVLV
ncbi:MAG: polysaccharide deacetylase family protein [Aquificaceae bacterium]